MTKLACHRKVGERRSHSVRMSYAIKLTIKRLMTLKCPQSV